MPFVWDVDREIIGYGVFALRWYSLLFAAGFFAGYFIVRSFFRHEGKREEVLDSLLFHLVAGCVIGARLGHTLLYEPGEYLSDPIRILKIWEGGLASHGGFTGVTIALILFARKNPDFSFFWVTDRVTIPTIMTAGLIRIGNMFNSEIIGKEVDPSFPFAVVFKKVDLIPRHPTPLYEALGYFVIAAILYGVYRLAKRKPLEGRIFGIAMVLGYGFRFFVERFKIEQVAFEKEMTFNMGQLLSVPFVLIGLFFALGLHQKIAFFRLGMSGNARQLAYEKGEDGDDPDGGAQSRKGQLRKQSKRTKP